MAREVCVESQAYGQDSPDEERSVPRLRDVRRIVQDDEALDLFAGKIRNGCCTGLPAQNPEPTYQIAEKLLAAWWCEL